MHTIGLVLDRMLTGRPLHGGKTDVETYREVLLDEPAPADRVNRAVSPDLAAICLTCLAKRPTDRYESAATVAEDLGRWLDGRPTQARPLSPAGRLARTVARRPVVAGLVAAAFPATCVAGWATLERSQEQLKGAAQQEEIRRQNAAAELRRGFDSLRAANVAGALAQVEKTRSIDPVFADSLAARWLERQLRGERELLLKTQPDGGAGTHMDLHCLAVSPDGHTAAVGGADGGLRLLRNIDGQPRIDVIPAHDEINDVSFSPDGRLIASAGQDGRVRWWSVDAPTSLAGEAPPTECPLYGVAFAADNASLYYGGEDHILRRVWDVDFEPDGKLLTAGADGTVRRWDRADASPAAVLRDVPVPGPGIKIVREVIAPAGRRLRAA